MLLSLTPQTQLTSEGSKLYNLMNNFNFSEQLQPGSGHSSPANVPRVDFMGPSSRADQKRSAYEAGVGISMGPGMRPDNSVNSAFNQASMGERPQKKPFVAAIPHMGLLGPEEKLGNFLHHQGFPLQNNLQRLTDYQNSLLASSLANRQAELAHRQLLSRYFSPQMRLNSLIAPSPSLGLAGLTGHQLPGTASAGAPATGLAALLSRPSQTPLQSFSARLQQQQQQQQQASLGLPNLQGLSTTGSGHQSERLREAAVLSSTAASALSLRPRSAVLPSATDMQSAGLAAAAVDDFASPIPLGIDEDPNWLSDFHVFVRKNLVELCWASSEDCALRNATNRVSSHQVGIRCRCCAHLNPSARAQRSSAFPSSIAQIYQSFTMMLRAHFSSCSEVPPALKEKFMALKSKTTQGATDSKQYWIYSARKLGMVDSEDGIAMTKASTTAARALPPFGSGPQVAHALEEFSRVPLVAPIDRQVASDFLYTLLLQARRVRLQANEQRGNKKSLQLGLPGFACRHCCHLGRMGQCRIFPARRRTLPIKVYDLYEHLVRCTACPQETKDLLQLLHDRENYQSKTPGHKEFLDLLWSRLLEPQNA